MLTMIRSSVRRLLRAPAFTAAVVLTLAIGIAANAAVFTVLDGLLLQSPPGVSDVQHLLRVNVGSPSDETFAPPFGTVPVSYADYEQLRSVPGLFSSLTAYAQYPVRVNSLRENGPVTAVLVSANYFRTLGLSATLGRLPRPETDATAQYEAVISDAYWRKHFGAEPGAVGRTLEVDGWPVVIAGVAPPDFRGIDALTADIFLPLSFVTRISPSGDPLSNSSVTWLFLVGRLPAGMPTATAAARTTLLLAPSLSRRNFTGRVDPVASQVRLVPVLDRYGLHGERSPVPVWIQILALTVMLLACCNIAGLFLARATRRRDELFVQVALGAPVRHVTFQELADTTIMAAVSAVIALWVAYATRRALPYIGLDDLAVRLDWWLIALVAMLALVAAVTSAAPFSLRFLRWSGSLRYGARQSGRASLTMLTRIMFAEMVLATALVAVGALLAQSVAKARSIPLGFDASQLELLQPHFQAADNAAGQTAARVREALTRIATSSAILDVAAVSSLPFESSSQAALTPAGAADQAPRVVPSILTEVTPGYFHTMRIARRAGRDVAWSDRKDSPPVIVVSNSFARQAWPAESPLGQCVRFGASGQCMRVIGVVADVEANKPGVPSLPQVYMSLLQQPELVPRAEFIVRTVGNSAATQHAVQMLKEVYTGVAYVGVESYTANVGRQFDAWAVPARVALVLAGVALMLAVLGIYAVTMYSTAARQRDIAIRIAIGATPTVIARQVLNRMLVLASAAVTAGLTCSIGAAMLLRHFLVGVAPADPILIGVIVAIMVVAIVGASVPSAVRAATTNAVDNLKVI